jgi:NADH-quinone oxidoreductase subunit H
VKPSARLLRALSVLLALVLGGAAPLSGAVMLGCGSGDTVDLLQVMDVVPRDVEVGDTIEVLGSGLGVTGVTSATVTFHGKLYRPGLDRPIEVDGACGPGALCIRVEGARPAPDKVSFVFTESLQTKFSGAGDAAVHTTFRGEVVVSYPPNERGQALAGRVANVTLDVRPPSARRVVMEARAKEGARVLAYLGVEVDAEAPPAGGLRVAAVRPAGPADRAGLVPGDVLSSFAGVTITSAADIAARRGERHAEVGVRRATAVFARQLDMSGYGGVGLPSDLLGAILVLAIAAAILLLFMAPTAGIITWVERRVSARMQSRIGPNRAGPQGFLVWIADGIKSIAKEDIVPTETDRALFRLAPYLVFVGVSATFVVMPFGQYLIAADLDIGILFVIAVTSLVAIGLMTGGWASNNKWSLLGGIRAAAQVISYEIPAAVAIVCVVMMTGSLRMQDIIAAQAGPGGVLLTEGGWPWYWFVFKNPVSFGLFFLFFTTALAEGNRAPFDLPEAESELVAGYSTEYSGMRYLFFFFAEWANVFVFCGIATALFLGGWQIPGVSATDQEASLPLQLLGTFLFLCKAWVLIFIVIWIRWTLPRVRIDQLMNLCWKWFVPLSFAAFMLCALWVMGTTPRAETGRALIPAWLETGLGIAMFTVALFGKIVFVKRVLYNLRQSKMPVHLNPFL